MSGEGTVVHAYGVVPATTHVDLPASGIDGAPVETVTVGELAALVSTLDATRYGAEVWQAHAEDPDWLAGFALAHQQVLSAVAATADVLPFRIPGMYDDRSVLVRTVEAEQDRLLHSLGAVRGQVEWGVKVFWDADAAPSAGDSEPAPASGQDYLRRRSEQLGSRERSSEERHRQVVTAYERIATEATDSVTSPPQDPALSGRREPMLLNSAHLVPRDREEPFFGALAEVSSELAASGLVVEVSGPWPPYNFVSGRHRKEETAS